MVDNRTNFAKDISFILRRDYGDKLRVFQTEIPLSIRAAETSAEGKSIYMHDPHGIAAKAYQAFTKEVQDIGKEQSKRQHKTDISR
jgi:chromosome partitioning protein